MEPIIKYVYAVNLAHKYMIGEQTTVTAQSKTTDNTFQNILIGNLLGIGTAPIIETMSITVKYKITQHSCLQSFIFL